MLDNVPAVGLEGCGVIWHVNTANCPAYTIEYDDI